jgi:hypothetical protein
MESVTVEINQEKNDQSRDESSEAADLDPNIAIVRNSTPKAMTPSSILTTLPDGGESLNTRQGEVAVPPDFPDKAPSAPPLPEEIGNSDSGATQVSRLGKAVASAEEPQEFDWLFEYGLEMDTTILNSPERLGGLALLYGPAVLRGYSILLGRVGMQSEQERGGRTIATVVPGSRPDAEVWGMLYRIPHRLRNCVGSEPSLLDAVHAAGSPQNLFRPVQAIVHETYRNRQIECVTYIATDGVHQCLKPLLAERGNSERLFVQRLTTIVRKLGLPDRYLSTYFARTALGDDSEHLATVVQREQDTEPLSAIRKTGSMPLVQSTEQTGKEAVSSSNPWMMVFAAYLAFKLLLVLMFAVLQGMGFGEPVFANGFRLLGVPWLVLMYGLLGGCISSIITLERSCVINPPMFVIITWFTRPYVGAALALLSYLFLTSGFFIFGRNVERYSALFLLVGALAGLCEGWIFQRHK